VEEKTNSIVLAGGGTGGHLYPALAVADEFKRRFPRATIVFVGAKRGLEQRLVPAAGYPLVTLSVAGLKGSNPLRKLSAAASAGWAVARCLVWMVRRRPGLVIGVGGYASGPAVLAAKLLRIRTMVLEQNHYPGATNRWLGPRVDLVCLPSEAARRHIGGRSVVTGNPVRPEFFEIGELPDGAELSLLVFGGSRGARSINRAMIEALPALASAIVPIRIVHQTGEADEEKVRAAYANFPHPHEIRRYLDDMPRHLARAGLVVCRAGASTLAELCAAGRPAVLVPYPHAADDHQRRNAESLVEARAAVMIRDTELDGSRLAGAVIRLSEDRALRRSMAQAARELGKPEATRDIVDLAGRLLDGTLEVEERVA
jgi:UDP-N-acetylglucosamine--N-acetylmuramyl-(pentapeptide) pyrophosphoryl-undecaprenol N-acetylglucosamine transferase